jgi:hypothetical protein
VEDVLNLLGRVMARESSELIEIVQIHRSEAETPLLVVSLAKRGHGGGAIGSGSSCRREHRKTSKTFIEGHRKVALIPC